MAAAGDPRIWRYILAVRPPLARATAPSPAPRFRDADMAGRVHRITMFKVPAAEDQQKLIEQYKVVDATNQKVRPSRRPGLCCPSRRTAPAPPPRLPTRLTAPPQDGEPYILSLAVGVAEEDPRAQGFTVVCKTEFASRRPRVLRQRVPGPPEPQGRGEDADH